jgi:hypothetical protein
LVERVINLGAWRAQGTFAGETKEDLVQQLNAVATWMTHYQQARPMYILGARMVKEKADIVVNGMQTIEETTSDILNEIKEKYRDYPI